MPHIFVTGFKKSFLFSCMALGLSACATNAQWAQPRDRAAQEEAYAYVQTHFTPALQKECVDDLKSGMGDPASLKVAGPAQFNRERSEFYYDLTGSLEVIYTMPIRGKNGFGAMVLNTANCHYVSMSAIKKVGFVSSDLKGN